MGPLGLQLVGPLTTGSSGRNTTGYCRLPHGRRLADEIPGVQERTLAGVGHVPTYDDPEPIVDTITDWIVRAYHPTDVG